MKKSIKDLENIVNKLRKLYAIELASGFPVNFKELYFKYDEELRSLLKKWSDNE